MPVCECENRSHFIGRSHKYEGVPASTEVDSFYGTMQVCDACSKTHFRDMTERDKKGSLIQYIEPINRFNQ